ncbi:MAG: TonB-dependent receptor [Pseudomonadota bacterium]
MEIKSRQLAVFVGLACAVPSYAVAERLELENVTVTGTREARSTAETPATVESVGEFEIEDTRPAHPAEIMGRMSGVHVNVTNGEGHMTAIRQPLTTGAVYLYLEDGIPTRSTGFFNHNALYETNLPQAEGIEVTKGPGTSLYGSDAIGGVINVNTKGAPLEPEGDVNVEAGEHGWSRLLVGGGTTRGDNGYRADVNITHTDGWRDGTEYDRQSANTRWERSLDGGATLDTLLSVSNIEQQTAGTSRLSEDDYKNDPTRNDTPISYRDVKALRLSSSYEDERGDSLLSVTPYVRSNTMEYMPNWSFSYDPNITETGHDSLGVLVKYRRDFEPMRSRLVAGMDVDYSPGGRVTRSIDAYQTDGIYTDYTVNRKVYDYDVAFAGYSPYLHYEASPSKRVRLNAGLRYDAMQYDYSTNLASGSETIDPESTSRPLTYNRPADAVVRFSSLTPKLGLTYAFSQQLNGFVSYRNAFRAPSEGQLFAPGSSEVSLDLDPVQVDSYETGLRGRAGSLDYGVSVYHMAKQDDLVRYEDPDTEDRYTVNAGETHHQGVELTAGAPLAEAWQFDVSYSLTRHTYEDWVEGGTDYSGNDMESAPEEMGNVRLAYAPTYLGGGRVELEWERLGAYWLDQSNTEEYDGHDLLHLRANYHFEALEVYGRIMNLTDERYATAGRFNSFSGDREFAPGLPRTVYAGITARF